jgi:general stress protein 26
MSEVVMKSNHKFATVFYYIIFLSFISTGINVFAKEGHAPVERDSVIKAAREIISHVYFCALITVDSSGTANVRTMNPFPPEDDMTVWMATDTRTRKYQDIKKNPKVSLYYANHAASEGYVTITGKAVLVTDKAEIQKRKREYWDQAFPDFKYLVLIKIVPERLEVINYKHKMSNASVGWLAPFVEFKK